MAVLGKWTERHASGREATGEPQDTTVSIPDFVFLLLPILTSADLNFLPAAIREDRNTAISTICSVYCTL